MAPMSLRRVSGIVPSHGVMMPGQATVESILTGLFRAKYVDAHGVEFLDEPPAVDLEALPDEMELFAELVGDRFRVRQAIDRGPGAGDSQRNVQPDFPPVLDMLAQLVVPLDQGPADVLDDAAIGQPDDPLHVLLHEADHDLG